MWGYRLFATVLAAATLSSAAAAQGVVATPVPDVSTLATKADVQAATNAAAAASTAAAAAVKTVNGISPVSGAVTVPLPTASAVMPPCISDTGSVGTTGTTTFAPWNHTHCSKARRIIATSATDGSYTYSYAANPFANPPVCVATAEVAAGVTDVINVQTIGTPTITSASFLVNRTQKSVVSLIGLTVLSIPASPGATKIHIICLEP